MPVRKALLYYFKKRLRLDVADALDRPQEAPVVVENAVELDAAFKRGVRMTRMKPLFDLRNAELITTLKS